MERFEAGDAQRRPLHGEVQESFSYDILSSILGKTAQQGPLRAYEGYAKAHETVDELDIRLQLGHYVIGEIEQSEVSMALLWPMVQLRPGTTVVEWTIERLRLGIAPIVAEEAPMPQHRFAKEPRRVTLQRRGTSVYTTANIMNTPEGMARLQSQLLTMAATMLNTFEYLAIHALLTCHDGVHYRDKLSMEQFPAGETTAEAIRGQIEYDASRFAAYHRDPEVEVANDMASTVRMLSQYIKGPYVFLFPQGCQNLLGGKILDRPGRIEVKTIGPDRQIMTMESMPSYYQLSDGSLAFPVKDQGYGRQGNKIQPLLRGSLIAEHFIAPGVGRDDLAYRTGVQLRGNGFSTGMRDIHVYNVESDEYHKLSFSQSFLQSQFVPDEPNALLPLSPMEYPQDSFDGQHRSAPPLYYFNGERGVPCARFAQIDSNIISPRLHRCVGETVASMLHKTKGDVSNAILQGMQLVRDLENAPYDQTFGRQFANIIGRIVGDNAVNTVPIGEVHRTIPIPGAWTNVRIMRQDSQGGLLGNPQGGDDDSTAQVTADLVDLLESAKIPPFMASFSGIQMLANNTPALRAGGTMQEMGKTAKRFLDAAKQIYAGLYGVFPDAVVMDPKFRPIGFQNPSGFATFFTAMFLNSRNQPLRFRIDEDTAVITPFVASPQQAEGLQADGNVADAMSANVPISGQFGAASTSIARAIQFSGDEINVDAHKKTPWVALQDTLRRASAMSAGAAARGARSGRRTTPMEQAVPEADLFGTASASTMAIGAEMPMQFRAQRARFGQAMDGVGAEDEEDMNSQNAQDAWNRADTIEDQVVRVCTLTYLTARCDNMDAYRRMMDADVLVPFGLLYLRPGIEHDMFSTVVAKSGVDTMFHGVTDTVVDYNENAVHQTRLLSFTVMHGAVMKSPDHVAILPSRMARRYRGGGGVRLFDSPAQLGDHYSERPDIIVMVVPYDFKPKNAEPMGFIDREGIYGPAGLPRFAGAREYEKTWNLSQAAADTRAMANSWSTEPYQIPNVSWTGESLNHDRSLRTPAKGHRRGGSHPGCRDVWTGIRPLFSREPMTPRA
jgi:hypothetical protein